MASTKNNEGDSLYVMINYPDQRKRFTVFYNKNENEKEGIVLLIPPTLTFSGFLGLLISKFKLDSSITKSHIRVKTYENERRIKTLDNTYDNQILNFTISTISDEDPDNVEEQKSLTTSQEYCEKLKKLENSDQYLSLFKDSKENNNSFYRAVINPLLEKYGNSLSIGESYPYRCKLLISDNLKDSRIWLYFIEIPKSTNGKLEFTFDVVFESNEKSNRGNIKQEERNSIIKELMNQQYQKDSNDVIEMVKLVETYYNDNCLNPIQATMLDGCINLFEDLEIVKSVSQNVLFGKMLSTISNVSNHFGITNSLARKLLFNSKWDEKVTMSLDETSIRLASYPHKTKDISLYKFNSAINNNAVVDDANNATIECTICYCDYTSDEMIELVCGHRYCSGCMSQYFKSSIQDGNGGSNSICCPTTGCLNKCIDDVTIETLSMEYSKRNGSKILIRDLIYSSSGVYQCPVDGCGRLALDIRKKNNKYAPYIDCLGHTFCLYCKKEGLHWPIRCNRPIYNENEDLFSYTWIIKNTTICLRCKFPIEKSTGCNHMKCSRCRFEFCYSCGQDYTSHGTCTGSDIDVNLRNKSKIFFDTITDRNSSSIDTSFIEEFFKGNFHSSDPLIKHIYQSLVTLITEKNFADKKSLLLLQNAAFHLYHYNKASGNDKKEEKEFNLKVCQQTVKKLLSNVITNGSGGDSKSNAAYQTFEINKNIRSLSAIVCFNGSKKQLFNVFVNSKFNEFKEEIVNQLNKIIPKDQVEYDAKKIRIYNLYGGQIKAVNEIIHQEPIFITSSIHESWIEPQYPSLTPEEIEKAQQEIEKEQIITIQHDKNTFTTLKPKKSKIVDHKLKLKQTVEQQLKLQEKLKLDQQQKDTDDDDDDDEEEDYDDDEEYDQDEDDDDEEYYDDDDEDDEEYYDDYEDEIQDEIYKKRNNQDGWW